MREYLTLLFLVGSGLLLGCDCESPMGYRDMMLSAAITEHPGFPDGENVQLVQFAYIGDVNTQEGRLRVVLLRSVLTGMASPRGQSEILIFDGRGQYVGALQCVAPAYPLWCEEGRIYLFGETLINGMRGNAWDLEDGMESARLIWSPQYGSWQE